MQRHISIIVGIIVLQVTAGCNRKPPPGPAPTHVAAATGKESKSDPVATPNGKNAGEYKHAAADKAKSEPVPTLPAKSIPKPKVADNKPERLAILAPGGPIVVDVLLTIGGRPHLSMFD